MLRVIQKNILVVINQKFLEPGHTDMEVATICALKKTNMKIEVHHDWANLIRSIGKKN